MDIYLIRHGETQANADGIVQGWLDTPLNEKGRSQAREAAKKFDHRIDAIYSSDLLRASQTAHEFRKKYQGIPYAEDTRIRERNFGDATGHHRSSYDWEEFWALNDTVSIPNAETLNDFSARVGLFIEHLKRSGHKSVLVVAHGGTLNRFQAAIDGDTHRHVQHQNATVTHIRV